MNNDTFDTPESDTFDTPSDKPESDIPSSESDIFDTK